MPKLPDSFQERLAFNIAYRTADFDDGDVRFRRARIPIETALNFIGNMWNNLYRTAAEISSPLLLEHRPVNLSGSHIGILIQTFVDEPLIMPQIQIRFRPIVSDEHFPVLDRVHGSGVDINIGVKFLHGDLEAPGFQKAAEGCGCDTFSKP